MTAYVFDIGFVLIALAAAYFISRQGFVLAAASLVTVLFASQISIGTFEVITASIIRYFFLPVDEYFTIYFWSIVATTSFIAVSIALTYIAQTMLPDPPKLSPMAEYAGRWTCGLLGGYLLAAYLLTVTHTFPAPREYGGTFSPELHKRSSPVLKSGPDYQFLALTEYVCDHASPLADGQWSLNRPIMSAKLKQGRWSSFPIRFALWREKYESRWQSSTAE